MNGIQIGLLAPVPPNPKDENDIIKNWIGDLDSPLVSVICFSFNHSSSIKDSLNGFLMQETDFCFEVIIHDDASTDGTQNIIKDYEEKYPNIIKVIYQKENQYSKGNKPAKYCFPKSRGKFIALCEGDDYWTDCKKLHKQASFLLDNDDFSICGHDAFVVEAGIILNCSKLPRSQKKNFSSIAVQKGVFILTMSAMFVNKIQSYPSEQREIVNEDNLIFSRLGEFGSYKYMPEVMPAAYRVHSGGVWSSLEDRKKNATSMNSFYWISQYYKKNNNNKLSLHYTCVAAEKLLSEIPQIDLPSFCIVMFKLSKFFLKNRILTLLRKFKD